MSISKANKPRILFLDIETKPTTAYVWRFWDENIGADQIIEPGGTIMVGAKWLGERGVTLLTEWEHGKSGMIAEINAMMCEADAIVTYNGDKFDLPILNGEFVLASMKPVAPAASIDVYKTVKGLKLGIHKLGYIGPLLKIGAKVKHEGFNLWKAVMDGCPKARKRMARYCIQDVRLLEALYIRVLPFIKNHPHLGGGPDACPACGSKELERRGYRFTRCFKVQKVRCKDCGHWHTGKRVKI